MHIIIKPTRIMRIYEQNERVIPENILIIIFWSCAFHNGFLINAMRIAKNVNEQKDNVHKWKLKYSFISFHLFIHFFSSFT